MSFVQNRFNALLGDEDTEVDKLGNIKPKEKKENESDKAPTRREVRRNGQRQPAVSPPSRRDRGNRREQTDVPEETSTRTTENVQRNERGRSGDRGFGGNGRGRQFDRHSGTGIRDNEKKVKQGWGEAGTAEFQGAHDSLDPNDPDAGERRRRRRGKFGDAVVEEEEEEDNTKTLSEYLAERKNQSTQQLPEARKANDGDDGQWKDAVVLEKKEDSYFVGKNHEQKSKSKTKKEKVFLEIDQPSHQRSQRGGGRNNNNRNRGSRDNQGSVNLSDSNAFPNLSA